MQVGGARPGRVTHSISWTTVAPFVHYMWLNYWQKRVFLTLTCGRKESDVTIFRVLSDQNWSTLKILVRELALSFWFSLKWALLTFRLPFLKNKQTFYLICATKAVQQHVSRAAVTWYDLLTCDTSSPACTSLCVSRWNDLNWGNQ